jgi:hypothetical protein
MRTRNQPAVPARDARRATRVRLVVAFLLSSAAMVSAIGPAPEVRIRQEEDAGIAALLNRLEQVILVADLDGYLALLAPDADRDRARAAAGAIFGDPGVTRAVVRERDRIPAPGGAPGIALRLAVDIFLEYGSHGRIVTWRLDIVRAGEGHPDLNIASPGWLISAGEPVSGIDGLERLAIDPTVQYKARNLTVRGEDVEFVLRSGSVFVARAESGVTSVVLIGDGEMTFRPAPEVERGQVRIFCGSDTLRTRFDAVLLKMPPSEVESHVPIANLQAGAPDPKTLLRAMAVFREDAPNTFAIDLRDLSRDQWSVLPQPASFVADVHTRKLGTITYLRDRSLPEDISVFNRAERRQIAVYASPEKLRIRGAAYSEDDDRTYDIERYEIEAAITPDRRWISGQTRLHGTVRASSLSSLNLRLADTLDVRSVVSAQHGRLLALRVKNQNSLVVSLPGVLTKDSPLDLVVTYSGQLTPEPADREGLQLGSPPAAQQDDAPKAPIEASYLYSNRSYWYAQTPHAAYATASIRVLVPYEYTCVASGEPAPGGPSVMGVVGQAGQSAAQKIFTFTATRPARYFSCVVSRFTRIDAAEGARPEISAEVTRRFRNRGPRVMADAASVAHFFTSLVGECPYPSYTIALVENDLPGGHSPAYFTVLNQVVPRPGRYWGDDPAVISDFPEYVLAHEVAHQWWGQAVGTRNYHEAWVSEGFAQYFAALYAQHVRGDGAYRAIVRQFRHWTLEKSNEGPVSLGSRLGHLRNDGRIFRAVVYNKGALVLHMLRQLLGDEVFFKGVRRYYLDNRFHKAGTAEVQRAFEAVSGQSLERFFTQWIDTPDLPRLSVSTRTETGASGASLVITVAQAAELFDVPVPMTLTFEDGSSSEMTLNLTERTGEWRVPLPRLLRRVAVNRAELAALFAGG